MLGLNYDAAPIQLQEAFRRRIVQVHGQRYNSMAIEDVCRAYCALQGTKAFGGTRIRTFEGLEPLTMSVPQVVRQFWERFGHGDERLRRVMVQLEGGDPGAIRNKASRKYWGRNYKGTGYGAVRDRSYTRAASGAGTSSALASSVRASRPKWKSGNRGEWTYFSDLDSTPTDDFGSRSSINVRRDNGLPIEQLNSASDSVRIPQSRSRESPRFSPQRYHTNEMMFSLHDFPVVGSEPSAAGPSNSRANSAPVVSSSTAPSRMHRYNSGDKRSTNGSFESSLDPSEMASAPNPYNHNYRERSTPLSYFSLMEFRLPTVWVRNQDGTEITSFRQWKIDGITEGVYRVRISPHYGASEDMRYDIIYASNIDPKILDIIPGMYEASQMLKQGITPPQVENQLNLDASLLTVMPRTVEAEPAAVAAVASFRALLPYLLPDEITHVQNLFSTASPVECLDVVALLAKRASFRTASAQTSNNSLWGAFDRPQQQPQPQPQQPQNHQPQQPSLHHQHQPQRQGPQLPFQSTLHDEPSNEDDDEGLSFARLAASFERDFLDD